MVEPVARVNGVAISAVELNRAIRSSWPVNADAAPPAEQQKELEKQALQQLVSAELLYQAGQKMEYKDLDKQVNEKLSQGRARFPNGAGLCKSLERTGHE